MQQGVSNGVGSWDVIRRRGKEVRRVWSVISTGDMGRRKEGCSWCSVAVLGGKLEDWFLGDRGQFQRLDSIVLPSKVIL